MSAVWAPAPVVCKTIAAAASVRMPPSMGRPLERLKRALSQRVHPTACLRVLERQLREAGEALLDVGPFAWSVQILVHDDVGDANLPERVEAGRIRKLRELPVQVVGEV